MPRQVHLLHDVQPVALALCKQGANRQRIFLKKESDVDADKLMTLPGGQRLVKNADWSHFYCVVAEPDAFEDPGMGDGRGSGVEDRWRDADEIRKAAHFFAKSEQLVIGMHGSFEPYGHVVENAVALADIAVPQADGTEQTIKKGSWYVGIEPSEAGKAAVDAGEFTGISLEGLGYRTPVELEKEEDGILRRLASLLKGSGSLKNDDSREDQDVDTSKIEAMDGRIEKIEKSTSALTEAVTGLVGTVNNLVERLDKKNVEEKKKDDAPDAETLKKSIEDLADLVGGKLDELESGVNALADSGSRQGRESDLRKSGGSEYELAGILN